MANLLDLALFIEGLQEKVPAAASNKSIVIARAIHRQLLNDTPVDTSEAVSNWVVSLNEPATAHIDAYFEGDSGSTYLLSYAEAVRRAEVLFKAKKPGQPIFITNNAPYIIPLNEGSSDQAPAGFIEKAQLAGRKAAEATFKL